MLKPTLIALALTVLSGCVTQDPYSGEDQASKAAVGAAIGAGVAAVGAAIENKDEDARTRNERILKSAAVGGAIGGGIGYYMDVQEAKLRERLANTGVGVKREGDEITLVMPNKITFAVDSTEVRSDFVEVLDSVSIVLKEFDKTRINVAGHTDSSGSDAYNLRLSQQRASAVSNILQSQGINDIRIATIGQGERQPVADNTSESGRQANRRIELTLTPIEAPAPG